MTEKSAKDIAVYMDGHEGHRGNVLAHAWVDRIQQFLSVLAKMERRFLDADKKKTDFEVVATDKYNPTVVHLKPVPGVKGYDPDPAVAWALAQITHVAAGDDVDERVDAETADMLAALARPPSRSAFKRFWVNGSTAPVHFDEHFLHRAQALAARRRALSTEPDWFSGVSHGSVVGELLAIDNISGERNFIIVPGVGPARIACKFPEHMREKMGAYVFKVVRVTGLLSYDKSSPHADMVEMEDIEVLEPAKRHLLDLEGMFAGMGRADVDFETIFHG